MAHKKGVGSTKNGRDSAAQRLGTKRADGQFVLALCQTTITSSSRSATRSSAAAGST